MNCQNVPKWLSDNLLKDRRNRNDNKKIEGIETNDKEKKKNRSGMIINNDNKRNDYYP